MLQGPPGPRPVQDLDAAGARPCVVVAQATNGPIETDQLDSILDYLGPDRRLVLVTGYGPARTTWIPPANETIRAFAQAHPDQVAEAVRNLNASTYLPKVVSTPTEQGTLTVHMQHTFNWVVGASDAQLNAEVSQFLMATIAMMNQLDIAFPDQWAKEADHA